MQTKPQPKVTSQLSRVSDETKVIERNIKNNEPSKKEKTEPSEVKERVKAVLAAFVFSGLMIFLMKLIMIIVQ